MQLDKLILSIGWAQGSLIFSTIFIIVFRKELSFILQKITKVSKDGIMIDGNQELQNIKNTSSEQELINNYSITINEQKEFIEDNLKKKKLDSKNKVAQYLIHQLAISQLNFTFERIYNTIFGSQIELLKKLNETHKDEDYIFSYFENVKNKFNLQDWNLDNYLSFLFQNNLIIFNERKKYYAITNYGQEFLVWLVYNGKTEEKYY